jgi:hypothetical protein
MHIYDRRSKLWAVMKPPEVPGSNDKTFNGTSMKDRGLTVYWKGKAYRGRVHVPELDLKER